MKKKLVCMFMAAVMVLALAACGGASGSAENSSEEGVQGTADGKTLKVAMECSYAPYNWTQPNDANGAVQIKDSSDFAYGYDVMMAKKIAAELGYDLEIIKSDWNSLIPAVQSGTIDCVIAGQSITSERKEMVDFTEPYYYASIVTLVKSDGKYADAKGLADLKDATCTSQLSTVWYDVCLPQIDTPKENILAGKEDATAMINSLKSGEVDLVVTDMPTAQGALVTNPDFKILDFNNTDDNFQVSEEEINIGISVRKGNKKLVDEINSVLTKMTEDDFNAMMDEATKVQPLAQ